LRHGGEQGGGLLSRLQSMGRSRLLGQYVVLKAFAGRFREINAAVAVIAAAFLLKLIFA
jgi:hypothetical protein